MATIETIPLSKVNQDPGLQVRDAIDYDAVSQYAEAMKAGDQFPPIVVYYNGYDYWLTQGSHRVRAAEAAGREDIEAEVRTGSREDAITDAALSNREHDRSGIRRSNRDRRRALRMLLPVHPDWSDRKIARELGVDHKTVAAVRGEFPHLVASNHRGGLDGKFYKTRPNLPAWMESPGRGGLTRGVHPLPIGPPATNPAPLAIAIKDADSWCAWIDGLAAFLGIPPEAALVRALGVLGRQTGYSVPPPSAG